MKESESDIDKLVDRCASNVSRAAALIKYYRGEPSTPIESTSIMFDELFRAAVVYLHAAIEDFLRGVGRLRLPNCDARILDRIPLLQKEPSLEPKKFLLGDLVIHRSKTIEELIEQSVSQYLERRTFSSASEVAGFLIDLSIPIKPFESLLGDIDSLMKRRHRIVHQADHNSLSETEPPRLSMSDLNQFMRWLTASQLFLLEMQYILVPAGATEKSREAIEKFAAQRQKALSKTDDL